MFLHTRTSYGSSWAHEKQHQNQSRNIRFGLQAPLHVFHLSMLPKKPSTVSLPFLLAIAIAITHYTRSLLYLLAAFVNYPKTDW